MQVAHPVVQEIAPDNVLVFWYSPYRFIAWWGSWFAALIVCTELVRPMWGGRPLDWESLPWHLSFGILTMLLCWFLTRLQLSPWGIQQIYRGRVLKQAALTEIVDARLSDIWPNLLTLRYGPKRKKIRLFLSLLKNPEEVKQAIRRFTPEGNPLREVVNMPKSESPGFQV